MELRQLRYFTKVCELGSFGKAALELGLATSALSQQISKLERELSTRLLQRQSTGVVPTDAGLAFLQRAQLILRHADDAVQSAQQARLSGHVNIGLASTTAAVLGVPLLRAMQARYPEVRVRLVEALSGHLTEMLNARRLDLAVIFRTDTARRWSVTPLLDERLYLLGAAGLPNLPKGGRIRLAELGELPLILPSGSHGLRALLDAAFARLRVSPRVVAEIDGLSVLMDAVHDGFGATIQPGAATARLRDETLVRSLIVDAQAGRHSMLASLSDDELSPAALAARVVLAHVARSLVRDGKWFGATILPSASR
ncbi:LysR substrate-binding domain-containing protein [Cupriavidus sp. AU9028]|uniref:LysR substrate-binding domain-containing protein n=1 Tax=Cupriavidus sp. AU9028 TaxID=2871157 RepID=UPI001C9446F2|nr:LysR substrate-binding domain-containing protein [Cupriavidus sp. AU9028]MBY4897034.1 LysR family transcriptional regulator [Cupriavidus sp. AU9028]